MQGAQPAETSRLRPGDHTEGPIDPPARQRHERAVISMGKRKTAPVDRIRVERFDRKLGIGVRRPVRGARRTLSCSLEEYLFIRSIWLTGMSQTAATMLGCQSERPRFTRLRHKCRTRSNEVTAPAFTSIRSTHSSLHVTPPWVKMIGYLNALSAEMIVHVC